MEIPTHRQHYALPSIAIGDQGPPDQFRHHPNAPFQLPSISSAMSIPGARDHEDVPPPLPPPRFILNDPQDTQRRPPPPSNYGSLDDDRERPNYQSRTRDDEGYSSLSSFGSSNRSAPKFGLSHDFYRFRGENEYDNSLLKKLDSGRVRENRSPPRRSALTSSLSDVSTRGPPSCFKAPLSLPMHPSRPTLLEQPLHSASSPRSTPYYSPHDYRSPSDMAEPDRSPYRSRRTNSGSITDDMASTHGSDADGTDFTTEETSQLRRLNIEDSFGRSEYRAVGQKRRASSPPGDEPPMLHSVGSASELLRRREPSSRGSPTPRLSIVPSASRSGSYSASTLASAPSTISAYLSPAGGLSPGGISPVGPDPSSASPYATPISLNPSPRPPILRNPHQRGISESRPQASPRKTVEQSFSHAIRQQPFFMCDCCPKKPKKFETYEELSAHEAEKQYECSFCGNRFKNKNEAERHQNSLHVRRHSWSCSALSHYDRAFHESTSRPGEADTCGYCGEEFARSGKTGQRILQATDQDWDERIRHLQEVHKFRECNSAKKFYRADHFRQHLKHSHAGTSGKWTNMLENACMVEEDPSPR